jgi:uncharacterized protein (TIGR03084 family)
MDPVVIALAQEQAELSDLLDGLAEPDWRMPTRCEGWDIADVVLHLAQTDEMALASAKGRLADYASERREEAGHRGSVDDLAARMVEQERGLPTTELLARWSSGAARLIEVFDGMDPSRRCMWAVGDLSARTLATTRIAETWIHAGDVAAALGRLLAPTDRLRLIARLAWRTLPYAFASAGRPLTGPVAFRLVSPTGETWEFVPEGQVLTTIRGPASELCSVAARRVDPEATSLHGEGPDSDTVLALVRTYA